MKMGLEAGTLVLLCGGARCCWKSAPCRVQLSDLVNAPVGLVQILQ